jgi:mono/diheme cytochrome c family protein
VVPVIINLEKRKIKKTIILLFIFIILNRNDAFSNENGKILSFAAGCHGCHTSNPNQPFGGGYKIKTKFGFFNSPNISKDKLNGIGNWSKAEFLKAVTKGISPDNKPYYPAFPYNWYADMTESDILDIYEYIYSLPAISKEETNHNLRFPYNIRELLWLWRFVDRIVSNKKNDIKNNYKNKRGEYLVNSISHCGACHSPRTFLYIVKDYNDLTGRKQTSKLLNDAVPNISNDNINGIGSWSKSDIVFFLQTGIKPNGDFAEKDMSLIIENGTQYLRNNDLYKIAGYLLKIKDK